MSSHAGEEGHGRYLALLLLMLMLLAAVVFSVNWMVDPLWFSEGNRFGEHNYIYNERVSKLNRFTRQSGYDCVVLGDSRVALLDAEDLLGARCFNLAFAGGNLRDLGAYAHYLKTRNEPLRRAVIGIGMFNFADKPLPDGSPDFVREARPPPGPLESYFSTEVLRFSLRTVFGRSPTPIYYDSGFRARILRGEKSFDRNPALREENWGFFMNTGPFGLERLPLLDEALDTLEGAELVGYVPPITADFISELQEAGTLDSYVESVHALSKRFAVFQDFSIPSPITRDPSMTYDGQHFYGEVNDRIVAGLNHGVTDFGVDVKAMDLAGYRALYRQALDGARTARR